MTSPTAPPRLKVEGLQKSFFGVRILHEVSFEAHGGRVLGIAGENGSGKTTTMNIMTGVLPPDGGAVLLDGRPFNPSSRRDSDAAGIAFIQQELNVFPNLSVAENLFLVRPPYRFASLPFISRKQMHIKTRELLARIDLEVSPDALAGTLSAGEHQLIEIARGLASDASTFIFDEPTSSLTAHESRRLFNLIRRLKQREAAVLYISHNLEEVLELADDVMVMRDGRVTLLSQNVSLSVNDLILAMVGRPIGTLFPPRTPARKTTSMPVLEACGISEPGVLENVSLRVDAGEIVGIAGLMGSGRSEFARILFGLDRHHGGVIRVNDQPLSPGDVRARVAAGVAFLTEDRRQEGLMMNASVAENLSLAALPSFASAWVKRISDQRLLTAIGELSRQLSLKTGDVRTTAVRTLSGGNQQKVMLGRWLLAKPRLFVLDEPTRGVDVKAKQEIYRLLRALAAGGMAILVISSELEELIGLCGRVHVMRRGELIAEFTGEGIEREAVLRAAFGHGEAA